MRLTSRARPTAVAAPASPPVIRPKAVSFSLIALPTVSIDPDTPLSAPASVPLAPLAASAMPIKLVTLLVKTVNACPTVRVALSISFASCGPAFSNAAMTCSPVSCPAAPSSRSLPMGTPKPSANALARRGVCSMMELSSSPRKTPLDRPCPSCTRAACILAALPPPMVMA